MRIISGKYKKKKINPPNNLVARPTTDMAKEALFNVLQHQYDFEQAKVLDLFSGTGSISYEFASRGTQNITLVESNTKCFRFIKKTIEELNFNAIRPIYANAMTYIKEHLCLNYDIIFADPPYSMPHIEDIPIHIFENKLINTEGVAIIEHSNKTDLSKLPYYSFTKQYSAVHFSFFYNIEKE